MFSIAKALSNLPLKPSHFTLLVRHLEFRTKFAENILKNMHKVREEHNEESKKIYIKQLQKIQYCKKHEKTQNAFRTSTLNL